MEAAPAGSVLSWGSNGAGQFGEGRANGTATPVSIVRLPSTIEGKTVQLIAAGVNHTVVMTSDNKLYAWGLNDFGQLGNGDQVTRVLPTAVDMTGVLAGKVVTEIVAGNKHTLVRTQDNLLFAWGQNSSSQLGNSTPAYASYSAVPVAVNMGALSGKTIVQIVAGGDHNLAVTSEKNVAGWGAGGSYQNGSTGGSNLNTPTLIAGLGPGSSKPIRSVAAGQLHSVALTDDTELVYSWGYSAYGSLGNNLATLSAATPIALTTSGVLSTPATTVKKIAAGAYHTIALTADNRIIAWGLNGSNQLGDGSTSTRTTPVNVNITALAGAAVASITCGQNFSYAITDTGAVFAWGTNGNGQYGSNSTTSFSTPKPIYFGGSLFGKTVSAYSLGGNHAVALDSAGKVSTWGYNLNGQLGTGNWDSSVIPISPAQGDALGGKTPKQTAAGDDFTAILMTDGSLFKWGANPNNQLGNGATHPTNVALPISAGALGIGSLTLTGTITSGSYRVSVPSNAGVYPGMAVVGTGIAASTSVASLSGGSLIFLSGTATLTSGTASLTISGAVTQGTLSSIAAGRHHTLGISNGRVYAWGENTYGQLGNNGTAVASTPVAVYTAGVLSGKTLTAVAAGSDHSLALASTGTLYSWGRGANGQLGRGTTADAVVPVQVTMTGVLAGGTITSVGAGGNRSFVLKSDGKVYGWGDNTNGLLGSGSLGTANSPVAVKTTGVLSGKTVTELAVGYSHTLVLTSDNKLFAWGNNDYGQLGTGDTTSSTEPVAVKMTGALNGKIPQHIYVGSTSAESLVLCDDGKLYAWGGRGYGQTGNNTWTGSLEPTQVTFSGSVKHAAMGNGFGIVATTDDIISTWGAGELGQLGTKNDALTPKRGPGDFLGLNGRTIFSMVAGHASATTNQTPEVALPFQLALTSDGKVYGWGRNDKGQLSTGTISAATTVTPTAISSGTLAFQAISAGGSHVLAIASGGKAYAWGNNGAYGALGNNSTAVSASPVLVSSSGALAGKTVTSVAAGWQHSLAATSDGGVYAWGYNASGQLGNGTLTASLVPVAVSSGSLAGKKISAVAATNDGSAGTSYALSADGLVYAWGKGASGQLGNQATADSSVPVAVDTGTISALAGKKVVALAAGATHVLALTSDNQVCAWGGGAQGQIGDGSTANRTRPFLVSIPSGVPIVAIAAQENTSYALASDGRVYAWGYGGIGAIGDNYTTTRSTPVLLSFPSDATVGTLCNIAAFGSSAFAWDTGGISFISEPQGLTTTQGGSFDLSCAVSTNGVQVNYQWWIEATMPDGTLRWLPVNGGSNPILSVSYADASNVGRYYVQVSSHLGSLTSQIVTVSTTPSAPAFNPSLVLPPIVLAPGGSATLSIPQTGFGTYQWKKNGVAIPGANGPTFVITGADASTAGEYTLTVTNEFGSSTSVVQRVEVSSGGSVVSWGANLFGQLGDGSSMGFTKANTTGVLAGKKILSTAGGYAHVVALADDGKLYAWGYNTYGQLGNNTTTSVETPVAVDMTGALSGKTITAVAASYFASYALDSDGKVYSWGYNANGSLGNGNFNSSYVPVAVSTSGVLNGKTVTAITASLYSGYALANDGKVYSWGGNSYGALGNGSTSLSNIPVAVSTSGVLSGKTITAIAAGPTGYHCLALDTDGKLYAWGWGTGGQLGNGTTANSSVPVQVQMTGALAGKTITSLSAGGNFSAVTASGQVFTWGGNVSGQLGNNSTANSSIPIAVQTSGPLSGKTVAAAYCGEDFCVVKTADNEFFAWGNNVNGQLGNGFADASPVPVKMNLPAGKTFTSATTAGVAGFTVVVSDSASGGEVYTTGSDALGQYGALPAWGTSPPVRLPSTAFDGKTVISITGGYYHSVALTSDGQVYTWGASNGAGQQGNGTTTTSSLTPVNISANGVLSGKKVVAISSGLYHTIAITSDGQLVAWGLGTSGQLGNGGTNSSPLPLLVTQTTAMQDKRFCSVAAAGNASAALTSDGQVFTWGNGSGGVLGTGSTATATTPVLVTGALASKIVVSLSASQANGPSVYAVTSEGRLYSWGSNGSGQLGNGGSSDSSLPVAVLGALATKRVQAVSAGWSRVLAFAEDGQLYGWGQGDGGTFGNGTTAGGTIPTTVTGMLGKNIQCFAVGNKTAQALTTDGFWYGWGSNTFGQVGDGGATDRLLPVIITPPAGLTTRRFMTISATNGSGMGSLASNNALAAFYALDSAKLIFTAPPQQACVPAGSTVTLSAGVHAPGVPIASYQWKKLTGSTWVPITGANTPVYVINSVDTTTVGFYALEATSAIGTVLSEAAEVGILTTPPTYATDNSDTMTVDAGTTFSISMPVPDGSGPFSYQWKKDGVPISGANKISLEITSADASSAGLYTLTASNSLGSVTSGALRLLVVDTSVAQASSVLTWGSNLYGQTGDGTGIGRTKFVATDRTGVLSGKTVTAVAAGQNHSLALTDEGKVYAWGLNTSGQLGNGTTTNSYLPVAVDTSGLLFGKRVIAVAAGASHSAALTDDGLVFCWGLGTSGQLGNSYNLSSNIPVAVTTTGVLAGKTITAIACELNSAIALTSSGEVFCWGIGTSGQLGNAASLSSNFPVAAAIPGVPGTRTITKITAGGNFAVALSSDNKLYSWGLGGSNQLGDGLGSNSNTPVSVSMSGVLSGKTISQISAGLLHTLVLSSEGLAFSWGTNTYGQLGNNTNTSASVPVAVTSSKTFTAVSAGGYHSYLLGTDGALYACGLNTSGQLAFKSFVDWWVPTACAGTPAGKTLSAVSAGNNFHSLLLTTTGEVYGCGLNQYGQLGDGNSTNYTAPVSIASGSFENKTIVSVVGGNNHSAALSSDGTVYTWGSNGSGQLGDGSTIHNPAPANISSNGALAGKTIRSLAAGNNHTLALTTDNQIVSWGSNGSGQLGNGSTTLSKTPVFVGIGGALTGETIVSVAAAGDTSFALTADGQVYGWGSGSNGLLGNGQTTFSSNSPILIAGGLAGKTVVSLAGTGSSCHALTADGLIYSWGYNGNGAIGDGTIVNALFPAQVAGVFSSKKAVSIEAGAGHVLALSSDGLVYAWGTGSGGQLGNGATTNSQLPVLVALLAGKNIKSLGASGNSSIALTTDGAIYAWGENSAGQVADGTLVNRSNPTQVALPPALSGLKINAVGLANQTAYAWNSANVTITGQPVSQAAVTGGSVTLSVEVSNPANVAVAYQWKRRTGSGAGATTTSISGAYSAAYTISPLNSTTAGAYLVDVITPLGSLTSDTAEVSVLQDPPSFSASALTPAVLASGGTLSVSIPVTGSGPFTYQWRRNGVPIPGATSATFTDPGALPTDSGSYTLVATNALGSAVSQSLAVQVGSGTSQLSGSALVWGDNTYGQLGNGLGVGMPVPAQMDTSGSSLLSGKTIVQMAAGQYHVLVLASDGKLYAWGRNSNGQLGNGTTTNSNTPVEVTMSGVLSGKTITAVAAGHQHSVVLTADGLVFSWGYGGMGQLGRGSTANATTPVAPTMTGVLAGKQIKRIAACANATIALSSDGLAIYAWGDGTSGQLGNNTSTQQNSPVTVTMNGALNGKTVSAIAAGPTHAIALTSDGLAFTWGANTSGQLGDNSTTQRLVPVAVTASGALSGKILTQASAESSATFAVSATGELFAWGAASRRGDGSLAQSQVPVSVSAISSLASKTVTAVSSGFEHTFVVTSDKKVYAFGLNANGQLGTGDFADSLFPTPINVVGSLFSKSFTTATPAVGVEPPAFVAGGAGYSVAAAADGTIHTWGANDFGQLGRPAQLLYQTPPTPLLSAALGGKKLVQVAAGPGHTVALADDGLLYAAGRNDFGQLGLGYNGGYLNEFQQVPMTGLLSNKTIVAVGVGQGHTTVLTSLGEVLSWGSNSLGQLGNGSSLASSNVPVALDKSGTAAGSADLTSKRIIGISVAPWDSWNMALTSDGLLYAWGNNANGQMGKFTAALQYNAPSAVLSTGVLAGKKITAIAAGKTHALALSSDGLVYAWGQGTNGSLGNAASLNSQVPVAVDVSGVLAGKVVSAIAAGNQSSVALTTDGKMYAWGINSYGEIGIGNTTLSNTPKAVNVTGLPSGKQVMAIAETVYPSAAAYNTTLALSTDAKLLAWGYNGLGEVGDGTTTTQTSPVLASVPAPFASTAFNGLSPGFVYDSAVVPFTLQPADKTANLGDSFQLQGAVHAPGQQISYQWKKETAPDSNAFQNIPGETLPWLNFTSIDLTAAGRYRLEVTTPGGAINSNTVTVTVAAPPSVAITSSAATVLLGGSVGFTSTVQGSGPFTYQWRRAGSNLSTGTSASLQIASAAATDTGDYDLKVTNAFGTTTSSTRNLTVLLPPDITSELTVSGLTDITFSYQITAANGVTSYSATGLPAGLSLNPTTGLISGTALAGGTSTVRITAVGPGGTTSKDMTLTVVAVLAPAFTTQPVSVTVPAGNTATLSAAIKSETAYTYQWMKNGQLLGSPVSCTGSATPKTVSLSLTGASSDTEGLYSLIATNSVNPAKKRESNAALVSVDCGSAVFVSAKLLRNGKSTNLTGKFSNSTISLGFLIPSNDLLQVTTRTSAGTTLVWRWAPIKVGTSKIIPSQTSSTLDFSAADVPKTPGFFSLLSITNGKVVNMNFLVSSFGPNSSTGVGAGSALGISIPPRSIAVAEGGTANFGVVASGEPALYTWYKVANGSTTLVSTGVSPYLTIPNISASDAASYYVVVQDAFGSSVDNSLTPAVLSIALPD
jgi:alpha-tubulin suppressor-like RCC1 family protein